MPDVFYDTPIPEIELALDGKVDFLKKTNPWGAATEEESPPAASEEEAADRLLAILRSSPRYRKPTS
ncbi:hypothetical protein EI613_27170 [Azospirillum sp. 412522]|nr:hypothetical protein [Azospirillum sp. 412522]MBY6265574.1 hypothetical protein [Azospirillum sp. 412522]